MASIINASTSAGLITTADTSGVLQLQSNGTTIATISSTGLSTQVGAPAFSAYANAGVNVTAATFTKVQLNTEEFDTNSNFDSSTNYRFTPTVAGYYQVNATLGFSTTSTITRAIVLIYKNGSDYVTGNDINASVNRLTVSSLIYMNGSTDYIELFGWVNGAGTLSFGGNRSITTMQASMVRSA